MFDSKIRIKWTMLSAILAGTGVWASAGVTENDKAATATRKPPVRFDRMFPDGREHDFGKVSRGIQCKYAFRIVNTFGVPLRIDSIRIS